MTATPGRIRALLAAGTVMVLAAGCATYSAKVADLRPQLAAGAYDEALATVAEETGGKDVLLSYLERGLIFHYAGRYQESNEAFAAAERTAEELYNRSLTEGAISLITNDMQLSYRARPFELAMVPYYRSLNYLELGLRDDALVEARKASLLLSRYIDATIQGIERGPTDELERTKNDPFLLYYSGMLYDWDGELNDAFIAYRNAATAYQDLHGLTRVEIPPSLARDLERVSANLGFAPELEQLRRVCPDVFASAADTTRRAATGTGEVVLLLEVGFVPQRTEFRLNVPIFEGEQDDDHVRWAWRLSDRAGNSQVMVSSRREVAYWLALALPEMQAVPSPVRHARLHGPGGASADGVRAHNLASTARITLEAEYPMILFKTVLRALTKYLASAEVEKKDQFLGLVANLFNVATETADTRSWLTLPEHVQLMRLRLPAGRHDLRVDLLDGGGQVMGQVDLPQVPVRAGDWTFLSHRVFPR